MQSQKRNGSCSHHYQPNILLMLHLKQYVKLVTWNNKMSCRNYKRIKLRNIIFPSVKDLNSLHRPQKQILYIKRSYNLHNVHWHCASFCLLFTFILLQNNIQSKQDKENINGELWRYFYSIPNVFHQLTITQKSISHSNQTITYKEGYNLINTHSYKPNNFTDVSNWWFIYPYLTIYFSNKQWRHLNNVYILKLIIILPNERSNKRIFHHCWHCH